MRRSACAAVLLLVALDAAAQVCPVPQFGGATDFATGVNPVQAVAADFNGDARLDLAVTNFSSGDVSLLLATASVTLLQNRSSWRCSPRR